VYNASGGQGSFQLTTEDNCAWQATANVSWLTITSEVVGIGLKTVNYSVKANPDPTGRSGRITIGGQIFKVKQKGN
jgi:hypothetical protein